MIRTLALAALSTLLGIAAAGCGGGAKSPSVASLATTSSSSTCGGASNTVFAPGIGGFGASMSTELGTGSAEVKYTACMRSHGVPNFPDPDAHGTLTITVSPSLNPNAPLFQKAEADCQHLLPARKGLSQARQQRIEQASLAFAACMRSHGVPKYPDPTFGSGGMVSRSEADPNSPIFQAAQKACRVNRASGG